MNQSNTPKECQNQSANYQLTEGNLITQSEYCQAIAFNKESNIMVAGCANKITVFTFELGQLKEKQLLSEHKYDVVTLYFMKKQDKFISGSWDNSILIWGINNLQQWYCNQLLENGHSSGVNCVIMNRNEDLIISCSYDRSIIFWTKKEKWVCSQILTNHTDGVWSISLNDSQNQLVSCGQDCQIIIYQQQVNNNWEKIQIIKVDSEGASICFIGNNIITFQPRNKDTMLILGLCQQTELFNMVKEVKVDTPAFRKSLFPLVFNKQKQILLNKKGQALYLMRKQNDADFVIDQTIKFGIDQVFGTITDDGEYLVTWDSKSQQFQVRMQHSNEQ